MKTGVWRPWTIKIGNVVDVICDSYPLKVNSNVQKRSVIQIWLLELQLVYCPLFAWLWHNGRQGPGYVGSFYLGYFPFIFFMQSLDGNWKSNFKDVCVNLPQTNVPSKVFLLWNNELNNITKFNAKFSKVERWKSYLMFLLTCLSLFQNKSIQHLNNHVSTSCTPKNNYIKYRNCETQNLEISRKLTCSIVFKW